MRSLNGKLSLGQAPTMWYDEFIWSHDTKLFDTGKDNRDVMEN
jgi:hypothetical protein